MSRKPQCFRPRLEELDGRVVPSANYFLGGDSFNSADWSAGHYPTYGDDVIFDGSYTSDNCTLSPIGPFNSVQLVNGYTGTVTYTSLMSAGSLVLEGGTLNPNSPGRDISVTQDFTWTGGTLNGTSYASALTVSGSTATATIAPTSGGTVNLGSTLNLSGGTVATIGAGTLNITKDGVNFNVNANSGMLVDPGALNSFTVSASFTIVNGVQLNIAEQAWVKAVSGAWLNATPVKNMGGSLILRPDTHVSFLGHVDNVASGPSIQQTAGVIYLYPGSILETNNEQVGMLMSGGALSIQLDEGGTDPAEITGNIKIIGGDIVSGANANGDTHLFGELRVEGNVTWLGGTYRPYLNAAADWDSDVWHVTGAFTIGGTAALAPVAVDAENNPVTPAADMHWILLLGDAGITAANNTPSYDSNLWGIDLVGNPVTKWELRSK
jgi:hypothetical protein